MIIWNPWHGCHKVSEGCRHCYMYFLDSSNCGFVGEMSGAFLPENVLESGRDENGRFVGFFRASVL